jgi:uridine kinase
MGGMAVYTDVFEQALSNPGHTSESILAKHLAGLPVIRASVSYKLVLSCAKVIAIAGDSGSGKSTLCNLIRPLFLFDKVLEYETDRYHKWERGDAHWNTTSHLHPDANHLEKLENDTFNLKVGNTVFAVDYDHTTGTFTPPAAIESKENILLCGLHTLYTKQLRDLSDLKIYLDTAEDLKLEWKIRRDTGVRNQTTEDVQKKVASRREDYASHVAPQREYADIVISRTATCLRIQAPGHREWVPGTGYWDSSGVDVRDEIYEFLRSLHLPTVEACLGFDGVIQLTVLRALYTIHG